ncbi:MAG: nucleoside deaminase [Chloroflexota bacterium]
MTLRWDTLAGPWQCCLEEAWTAYCMGSIPIGAAITDQHGQVVARGRNRIFEETAPGKLLCGHRLAHAEMNALIALDWRQRDPRTHVLYTTTEPCALCIGALRMTGIGEVRYAARDSAAGSIALLDATPFMRRGGLRVAGPIEPELEAIIVALHVEFSLRTGHFSRASRVLETWRTTVPRGVALGQELFRSGQLHRGRAEHASVAQVMHWLTSAILE